MNVSCPVRMKFNFNISAATRQIQKEQRLLCMKTFLTQRMPVIICLVSMSVIVTLSSSTTSQTRWDTGVLFRDNSIRLSTLVVFFEVHVQHPKEYTSDRSIMGWTHWAISCSIQCSTTGVTKAVVCVILSVGWCI